MTFTSREGLFLLMGGLVKEVQKVFLLLGHLPSTEEGESPPFRLQRRNTTFEALLRA